MADLATERRTQRLWMIWALVLLSLGISFMLGRYPDPYITRFSDLTGDDLTWRILLNLRLPRVIGAFMTGMVLSASGMVFQMLFRNPLVESGFLGVSQGAAFGASLAIVALGGAIGTIQLCAAFFACIGLAASYFLATRIQYGGWVLRLVLSGIAISALYTSGTGVLKYLADPLTQLPDITFWMLGGLWGITWLDIIHVFPIVIPCLAVICLMRWRLNLLCMKDEIAFSLSAQPSRERIVLLLAAVVSTAVVVAKAGQIAWVGLIVPHIARKLVGSDAQRALPVTLLIGGFFVLVCDDIARTVLTGEIPLGILTSFIGAGLFLVLLTRRSFKVN